MFSNNQKYQLAPYVSVGLSTDSLKIGFGSIQQEIKDISLMNAVLSTCVYLKQLRTSGELESFFKNQLSYNNFQSQEFLEFFLKNKFLIVNDTYDRKDRYSRHHLYYNMYTSHPQDVQTKLANAHIVICGCGGIGNIVAVSLATMGVGELTLIDKDDIELSNLTRQYMYTENDIGLYKIDILEREIKRRNNAIKINKILDFFEPEGFNEIKNASLIVLSGDSKNICSMVNNFCYKNNIPFLNIGYILDVAVWGPFIIPGKTPCYECFEKKNISNKMWLEGDPLEKIYKINETFQPPSTGPINLLASSSACFDIMKYIGNFGEIISLNRRVGLWTNDFKIQYQDYDYSQNCSLQCQHYKK